MSKLMECDRLDAGIITVNAVPFFICFFSFLFFGFFFCQTPKKDFNLGSINLASITGQLVALYVLNHKHMICLWYALAILFSFHQSLLSHCRNGKMYGLDISHRWVSTALRIGHAGGNFTMWALNLSSYTDQPQPWAL